MNKNITDELDIYNKKIRTIERDIRKWLRDKHLLLWLQYMNEAEWKVEPIDIQRAAQQSLHDAIFGMRITKELNARLVKNGGGIPSPKQVKELHRLIAIEKLEAKTKKAQHE
jgi:hypothetical protein